MKTKLTALLAIGLFIAAVLSVADVAPSSVATSSSAPPISIRSTQIRNNIQTMLQKKAQIKVLPDIPGVGGARTANNQEAAYYAWQEFVALNWPNVGVTGKAKSIGPGSREFADMSLKFGQPPVGVPGTSYPALVWESTRHRAEIFTPPPSSSPTPSPLPTPYGYKPDPTASWGYNSTPGYVYPGLTITQPSSPPTMTPFVNLDEASQIGTCKMYLGGAEVLFMAKANYMEYGYVASRGWYNSAILKNPPSKGTPQKPVASYANTSGYIVTNGEFPAPGVLAGSPTATGSYVSLPNGTIEFKAAFRVASDAERQAYESGQPIPGGYHAAPIRYYNEVTDKKTGKTSYQYVDTVGVLLSLHIIHKTPTAPFFIFATFEHQDNVIGPDGNPVEDTNGALQSNAFTSSPAPVPSPPYVYPSAGTAPTGQSLIPATAPIVFEYPSQFMPTPTPSVSIQQFIPTPSGSAGTKSTTQSSYQNTRDGKISTLPAANSSSEANSYITVNRRRYSIPSNPIVAVNQDIHSLIAMYGYNTTNNVWLNYKLVNVQWVPAGNKMQKTPGKLYGDTSSGAQPIIPVESFYLSNSLVETNMILSAFSGKFANFTSTADGLSITDFYDAATTYTNNNVSGNPVTKSVGAPFYNIYTKGGPYNMGGCMGCHGNTTVNGGSDASFILGHGKPFVVEGIDPPSQTMLSRFRGYFSK